MPLPAALVAALPAITGGIGQGVNAWQTAVQNRKSREFSRSMYDLQRQHALSDFHMINEYNSPAQQMARLKAAGVNPLMAFGKSAGTGIAGQVRSSDIKNPQFNTPEYGGVLTHIPQMFDYRVKQAQANNLEKMATTEVQKSLLLAAQTDSATTDADIKRATKNVAIEAAEAARDKTVAEARFQLDENERRSVLTGATLKEKMANVLRIREQNAKSAEERKNLRLMREEIMESTRIKKLERGLMESGIYKHDSMLFRWIGRMLDAEGGVLQLKKKLEGKALEYFMFD
jgi:hypothetical protein